MSNGNGATKPKDAWDKLDVIAKLLTAIVVSTGIAYYGIYSENRRFAQAEATREAQNEQAESSRKIQTAIQLLTNREAVTAEMRTKMFSDLIQHYFKGRDPKSKIVIIELMALNLEHVFQLRPLFDDLDSVLRPGSEERRELRRVARNAAKRQAEQIVGNGGTACEFTLEKERLARADCAPVTFKLMRVREDSIIVERTEDGSSLEVSYFDMPLVDNSTRGELRYSVVLVRSDRNTAVVRLVVFPAFTFSAQDRLGNDQLIGEFLLQKIVSKKAPAGS